MADSDYTYFRVKNSKGEISTAAAPADADPEALKADLTSMGLTPLDTSENMQVSHDTGKPNPTGPANLDVDRRAFSAGTKDIGRDVFNYAVMGFKDSHEQRDALITQYMERRKENDAIDARQRLLESIGQGGSPTISRMLPRLALETGATLAMPEAFVANPGRRVTLNALVAGAGEVLANSEENFGDALKQGGFGAAGAMVLGGLFEAPGALKYYVQHDTIRALKATGAFSTDVDPFLADADAAATRMQLTPDEAATDMPLRQIYNSVPNVANGARQQFIVSRAQQVQTYLSRVADTLLPNGILGGGVTADRVHAAITAGKQALKDGLADIQQRAQEAFQRELDPAIRLAGAQTDASVLVDRSNLTPTQKDALKRGSPSSAGQDQRIFGGANVLPGGQYVRNLLTQRQQAIEAGLPTTSPVIGKIDAEIERMKNNDFSWTLGGFQSKLAALGQEIYGGGAATGAEGLLNSAYTFDARAARQAMLADMDNAINAVDPHTAVTGALSPPQRGVTGSRAAEGGDPSRDPYDAALNAADKEALDRLARIQQSRGVATYLRNARNAYQAHMEEANQLEGRAVDRLLGGDKPYTAEEFKKAYFELPSDGQLEVMQYLDRWRPQVADNLRGVIFQGVVNEAKGLHPTLASGPEGMLDVRGVVDVLGRLNANSRTALLPKGATAADADQVLAGLRVFAKMTDSPNITLWDSTAGGVSRGIWSRLKAVAINAVLRNPGFMAAAVTGELAPLTFQRLLYTREGLESIQRLGDPKLTRAARVAAFTAVINQAGQAESDLQAVRDHIYQQKQEEAQKMEAEKAAMGGAGLQ